MSQFSKAEYLKNDLNELREEYTKMQKDVKKAQKEEKLRNQLQKARTYDEEDYKSKITKKMNKLEEDEYKFSRLFGITGSNEENEEGQELERGGDKEDEGTPRLRIDIINQELEQ